MVVEKSRFPYFSTKTPAWDSRAWKADSAYPSQPDLPDFWLFWFLDPDWGSKVWSLPDWLDSDKLCLCVLF